MSFSDLWNIALDIFEGEVEEHLQGKEKGVLVDDTLVEKDAADESDMSDNEVEGRENIVVVGGGLKEQITSVKTSVFAITITEHSFEASDAATYIGSDVMSGESILVVRAL